MELYTKLSYIDDIKDGMKRRYVSLTNEKKSNGTIAEGNSTRGKTYAEEMHKVATGHYLEVKHMLDTASKSDRVANQLKRAMNSITYHKEKIFKICGYD